MGGLDARQSSVSGLLFECPAEDAEDGAILFVRGFGFHGGHAGEVEDTDADVFSDVHFGGVVEEIFEGMGMTDGAEQIEGAVAGGSKLVTG